MIWSVKVSNNLIQTEKILMTWIVEQIERRLLPEEFTVLWLAGEQPVIDEYQGNKYKTPKISASILDGLEKEGLLVRNYIYDDEYARQLSITPKGYRMVETEFGTLDQYSPNTSRPKTLP